VREPARRRLHLGTGRTWLVETGAAFVTVGLVVLLFVAYELVGTNLSEQRSQAKLARQFASEVAHAATAGRNAVGTAIPSRALGPSAVGGPAARGSSGGVGTSVASVTSRPSSRGGINTGPTTTAVPRRPIVHGVPLPVPPPGGAVDHLVIPAIGVSRYVVQGVSDANLQMGPGHYPGTPLPGEFGNVAIAGHRTTFGAPFFRLNEVVPGDLVYLTDTSGITWVYGVRHLWVVVPTDTGVLAPTRHANLTLTTCNPRFEAISRLVVRAVLLERLRRGTLVPGRLPVIETEQQNPFGAATSAPHRAPASAASTRSRPVASLAPASVTGKQTGKQTGPGAAVNSAPDGQTGFDTPTVGASPLDNANVTATGGTWAATVGWAVLALFAWVATRVAASHRRRYEKVALLAAGALVCLVPLWFAFQNLVVLLPPSI
jgi:sortase A